MNNTTENDAIKAMAGAKIMLRHLRLNASPLPLGLLSQILELDTSLDDALRFQLPSLDADDFKNLGFLALEELLPAHGEQQH